MNRLPPLDVHAHVDPGIAPNELTPLGVVFAATRSLDEADEALQRQDPLTVWGVGCHPKLVGAQRAFDIGRFVGLISRTAFVSEIGLDGSSRVDLSTQEATLGAVLGALQTTPRIASIHSYKATGRVLDALTAQPIAGAILHWWLGTEAETKRAVEMGCFFSINASSVRRPELLRLIPKARLLTETDHPFGDRRSGATARPGNVEAVEQRLAKQHGISPAEVRLAIWRNLATLVGSTGCSQQLPPAVRRQLLAS